MSTSEDIKGVRRAKEQALEDKDYGELQRLREVEANLLKKQTEEFKPNRRGA